MSNYAAAAANLAATERTRQPRHLVATEPAPLAELAATANREHELCEASERTTLRHAIAAGKALIACREHAAMGGNWQRWLALNFRGSIDTARTYVRLAAHEASLDVGEEIGITEARRLIAGLPDAHPRARQSLYPPEIRAEAVALAREIPVTHAAEKLGIPHTTLRYWCDPKAGQVAVEKHRAERAALKQVERDKAIGRAVRKAGQALAESYSLSNRMDGVLNQALSEATDDAVKADLLEAIRLRNKMADAIVRALGVAS